MTTRDEQRKQVIRDYFDAGLGDGDPEVAGGYFTEDCEIWLVPSVEAMGMPRPMRGRQAWVDFIRGFLGSPGTWRTRSAAAERFYVDGDGIAAHIRLVGDMPNGAVYENEYVFLFEFEGEQISVFPEFTDTAFITAFLTANAPGGEIGLSNRFLEFSAAQVTAGPTSNPQATGVRSRGVCG